MENTIFTQCENVQTDADKFMREYYPKTMTDGEFKTKLEADCGTTLNLLFKNKAFDLYVDILEKERLRLNVEFVQPYILNIRDVYFDGFKKLVILYFHELSEKFIKSLFRDVDDEQILSWLFKLSCISRKISDFCGFKLDVCVDAIYKIRSCVNFLITQFSEEEMMKNDAYCAGVIMNELCASGTTDMLCFFLNQPPIKNNISKIKYSKTRNVLHTACIHINEENTESPLETVLKSGLVDTHIANKTLNNGKTPLQLCVEYQTPKHVKMLLDTGLVDKFRWDMNLYKWLFNKNYDVLKLMFSAGLFDIVMCSKNRSVGTILHTVVRNFKSPKIITDILQSTNLTDEIIELKVDGCTFMHDVCKKDYANWEEVLGYILDSGRLTDKFIEDFVESIMSKSTELNLYNPDALEKLRVNFGKIFDNLDKKYAMIKITDNLVKLLEEQTNNYIKAIETNENMICEFQNKIMEALDCIKHCDFIIEQINKKQTSRV